MVSCKWSKLGIGKMWKRDYSLLSICRADLCDFGLYIIRSWTVCIVDLLELHCIFSMFYPGNRGLWDYRITESFVSESFGSIVLCRFALFETREWKNSH